MKREMRKPGARGSVRIIGGSLKRSKLEVVELKGLRPTPDRVRETLFNWLGNDWSERRVMDCYAGTGALGFEALSRGAEWCTFVEKDPIACQQINQGIERFQLEKRSTVLSRGVETLNRSDFESVDVIFADPPFNHGLAESFLTWIRDQVPTHCRLVIESERQKALNTEGFSVLKELNAGMDRVMLLRPMP